MELDITERYLKKIPNYLKLKNPWVKEEIKEKLESILS